MTLELNIYGDSSRWLVEQGVKLLTLRLDNPKYDDLLPGRTIHIRYEQGQSIGVVFNRQLKSLRDYSPAELLLDGYLDISEAVFDLKNHPRYKGITLDTPILGIGVTSLAHFYSYLDARYHGLIQKIPLHKAILLPEFHDFFLPSYLWWAILKAQDAGKKLTIAKWHNLLSGHLGIFSQKHLQQVRSLDQSTRHFYQRLSHNKIKNILKYESTGSPLYRSLVLCQPLSVE